MFEQLEKWYPGRFTVEYDRDIADYVYETRKLATLAGKKLHGKRHHINKFKNLYPDGLMRHFRTTTCRRMLPDGSEVEKPERM